MKVLQGQLEDGVLANLLQYLALNRASGCLTLRSPTGERGEVFLDDGQLSHVRVHEFSGTAAMSVLLAWTDGSFSFRSDVTSPEQADRLSVESVLLDASRQLDEARRTGIEFLSSQSVLKARPMDAEADSVAMTLRAVTLYRNLDGVRSLAEIAEGTGSPLEEIVEAAHELRRVALAEVTRAPTVDRAFLDALSRELVELMGPVGEFVVEDAAYDLELVVEAIPQHALDDLLAEVERQLDREDWKVRFRERVRELREGHGIVS